jgi:MATE family multidrug resistance protein
LSRFKFLTESRKTLKLAVPIIIGNVGHTIITLTDNIMVGRLGANSLGAAGFSGSLFYVFLLFGVGLLAPTAALFAQSHSREDHHEGGELLRHAVFAATLVSLILMLFLWFTRPFMAYMGQTAEVVELSKSFSSFLIASLLPSLLYQAYKQFTDGIGKTTIGMYVMIAAILINIIGNYIFIHGLWGMPALGLNGSGLATLLSRSFMALVMMIYIHRHPEFQKYFAHRWRRLIHQGQLKKIFYLGLPNGFTYVFEVGAFSFSSIMMGWLGAAQLAAHQIALNLASISFLVTVGIGAAGTIRVSSEIGLKHPDKARYAGRVAMTLGAVYMLFSAFLVFNARQFLASIYTYDLQVIAFASTYLVVAAAFQFFDGIQAVAIGILRGFQDTTWPSVLALVAYWIIGLPIGYSLCFHLGLAGRGIWWGLFIGLLLIAIFLALRFERLSQRYISKKD